MPEDAKPPNRAEPEDTHDHQATGAVVNYAAEPPH